MTDACSPPVRERLGGAFRRSISGAVFLAHPEAAAPVPAPVLLRSQGARPPPLPANSLIVLQHGPTRRTHATFSAVRRRWSSLTATALISQPTTICCVRGMRVGDRAAEGVGGRDNTKRRACPPTVASSLFGSDIWLCRGDWDRPKSGNGGWSTKRMVAINVCLCISLSPQSKKETY